MLFKRLCPIVFLISISGPALYYFKFFGPHMWLQSVLLNPSLGPFQNLPGENEDLFPDWEIKTATGEICKVPFRRQLGRLKGATRYRLPFYFAEYDFLRRGENLSDYAQAEADYFRGAAQATEIEKYWICHLSGCPNPVRLTVEGKTWDISCHDS